MVKSPKYLYDVEKGIEKVTMNGTGGYLLKQQP